MDRQETIAYLRRLAAAAELLGEQAAEETDADRARRALEAIDERQWRAWREGNRAAVELPTRLAAPLRELVRAGSAPELDAKLVRVPPGLWDLLRTPGIGPARARTLWQQGGIVTLKQLRRACQRGAVARLRGFDKGLEAQIEQALHLRRQSHGRWLRLSALRVAERWRGRLQQISGVTRVALAGEIRRACETAEE
ncbi:MAG: hypothetical protein GF330_01650, partial [Candidatus Eisenbacteria bacterium]|nr:hypothetical protein [Candidatus Eisenbacteria bacterium]